MCVIPAVHNDWSIILSYVTHDKISEHQNGVHRGRDLGGVPIGVLVLSHLSLFNALIKNPNKHNNTIITNPINIILTKHYHLVHLTQTVIVFVLK